MENRSVRDPFRPRPVSEEWVEKEGIPVHKAAHGIEDITELPRRPWARTGGLGAFVELAPCKQAGELMYVAEIPPGGALEPERHMYNERIYVLRGRGLTEVWYPGEAKRSFEWGEGALFPIPMNVSHRLVNGGREPALFFAMTNAPVVMEAFPSMDFVFNCDYRFTDVYAGEADFFAPGQKRERDASGYQMRNNRWYTNFIPDVRNAFLDDANSKVAGGQLTFFYMAGGVSSHASEWPVGRYHKAHFHGPGVTLLGLKGEGYVLIWPRQYGVHPFQDGHGDKVEKVIWKVNSLYSPGLQEFHHHFNTGHEAARHVTFSAGDAFVMNRSATDQSSWEEGKESVRNGGNLIEYEDEDPEVRRMFEAELKKKGIQCAMPPVTSRTDPFKLAWQM